MFRKRLIKTAIFSILILALVCIASCTQEQQPIDPGFSPTLTVKFIREYYSVGASYTDLNGTLCYTDEKGIASDVKLSDEGVWTDFSTEEAEENKTLNISYKDLSCSAVYHVIEPEPVSIEGTFITDKNTTLTFSGDNNSVIKKTWLRWYDCKNDKDPISENTLTYTVTVSAGGRTCVKIDGVIYYPDGNKGIRSYPSKNQYKSADGGFAPITASYYVSTNKEADRSTVNSSARNKYLVMKFDDIGNASIWFTSSRDDKPSEDPAFIIEADTFIFDATGIHLEKTTINKENAENLRLLLNKDGYNSEQKAFTFVSDKDDDGYVGYSYIMKLSK